MREVKSTTFPGHGALKAARISQATTVLGRRSCCRWLCCRRSAPASAFRSYSGSAARPIQSTFQRVITSAALNNSRASSCCGPSACLGGQVVPPRDARAAASPVQTRALWSTYVGALSAVNRAAAMRRREPYGWWRAPGWGGHSTARGLNTTCGVRRVMHAETDALRRRVWRHVSLVTYTTATISSLRTEAARGTHDACNPPLAFRKRPLTVVVVWTCHCCTQTLQRGMTAALLASKALG